MIDPITIVAVVISLAVLGLLSIKTFTTVGFHESVAADGLTLFNAIADEHVTISVDDITVPELDKILAVFMGSSNCVAGQLKSPSLRRVFNLDIHPVLNASYWSELGIPLNLFIDNPIQLERSEKINALIDNGANAEDNLCLLWLTDGVLTPASGDIRTLKFTMTGITDTYAWTNQALTLSQTLPAGRYAVVGLRIKSTTNWALIAARLVFVGGTWRPGTPASYKEDGIMPAIFRYGKLGVWGEFEFGQPPTLDLLAMGATGAIEGYLDLIQIRKGV